MVVCIQRRHNSNESEKRAVKSPILSRQCKWCHAGGFHMAVVAFVKCSKEFVMRSIPRLGRRKQRKYHSWRTLAVTPDPAGSLNVFGDCLGLTVYHHQT